MVSFRNLLLVASLSSLALIGSAGALHAEQPARGLTIVRSQRVIRVPLQPMQALPMPRPMPEWKESRGAKCISPAQIAAAAVNGPKSVDFTLTDRTLLRAKLQNSCPALDYYSGFYLKPGADGMVCQDRDAVHARSGGECQIDAFRKLTPKAKR